MPTGRVARWIVRGAWSILAIFFVWLVAFSGIDVGSRALFGAALLLAAFAILCLARAFDTPRARGRARWAGRALGLLGAVAAISFPAVLYQEIAMLVAQGRALTYDIPRALWYEFAAMPLVVIPALIALRWTRTGGVLFLLQAVVNIVVSLTRPFGVLYPEATASGFIGIPVLDLLLQPGFITAGLLLIGGSRGTRTRAATRPLIAPTKP